MASDELGWRRPLGIQESAFYQSNFRLSNSLRFSTSRELTEHDVIKALVSLQRITPNLRMTIQMRDGQAWMREMVQEKIDFKVLEDADHQTVLHEMLNYTYKEGEPYWAARFLPSITQKLLISDNIRVLTDEQYPFVSYLVIGFHHCITDGFTVLRTVNILKGLLEDVLSDRPIDDKTQVGELIDTKHEQLIYNEIEQKFLQNPQLLEQTKTSFENFITETMIDKIYSVPTNVEPATIELPYIFDREITEKFHARCRSEKVTFHSGFSSVIEAALVKLFLDSNIKKPFYQISSLHCINQRPYFKDNDKSFGCGCGVLDVVSDIPKDVSKQFWSHVKEFHNKFKIQQKQKASFYNHVMHKLTGIELSSRMKKADPPYKCFHYISTNSLDMSGHSPKGGSNVSMEFRSSLMGIQSQPVLWISGFQTVHGHLIHLLMYNAHYMPAEMAHTMVDNIREVLCEVVDQAVFKL